MWHKSLVRERDKQSFFDRFQHGDFAHFREQCFLPSCYPVTGLIALGGEPPSAVP